MLYDSKQVIEQAYQEKKAVKPDNTVRNQESAISIFSKFCKEKYKTTPLKLCNKLGKESDIRVPCGILQAWIAWSVKQNHAASTIRTRFWYIKDFMCPRVTLERIVRGEMDVSAAEELVHTH